MKQNEVNNFEMIGTCNGSLLKINGNNYDDIEECELIELVNDIILNSKNSPSFLKSITELALINLDFEAIEHDSSVCDECGNENFYAKYKCAIEPVYTK